MPRRSFEDGPIGVNTYYFDWADAILYGYGTHTTSSRAHQEEILRQAHENLNRFFNSGKDGPQHFNCRSAPVQHAERITRGFGQGQTDELVQWALWGGPAHGTLVWKLRDTVAFTLGAAGTMRASIYRKVYCKDETDAWYALGLCIDQQEPRAYEIEKLFRQIEPSPHPPRFERPSYRV